MYSVANVKVGSAITNLALTVNAVETAIFNIDKSGLTDKMVADLRAIKGDLNANLIKLIGIHKVID